VSGVGGSETPITQSLPPWGPSELRSASPRHPSPITYVGLALREAESRWPDVAYRSDDPAAYARALEPVLELLAELSPTVEWSAEPSEAAAAARHEPTARYAIFLDGTGLAPLFGSEERLARLIAREVLERAGHQVRVGIADGRFAALRAATSPPQPPTPPHPTMGPLSAARDPRVARGRGGEGIVPPGGDAAFLAPLPVALLPLPAEARERVARLGARTLAEYGKLPANALRHRFGPDGVTARALVAGHDEGPLRARPTPLQLHDTIDLEWVETSLDRLLFLLKRLADRLSVRLSHHGLGCGRLRVCWLLDDSGLTTGDDVVESPTPQPPPSCLPWGPVSPWPCEGEGEPGAIVSTVRLAEPAGSGASLLEHLRWHVEGLRPETFRDPATGQMRGVRGIVVEAEELAPLSGRQLALLPGEDGRMSSPERLIAAERALARLQARWGEAAVRQAELVASRRPERAFRWREAGLAFQLAGPEHERTGGKSRLTRTPRPAYHGPLRGANIGIHERWGRCAARASAAPTSPRPPSPLSASERGLGVEVLWLREQPEDVEVDRGGRLPNGRWRPAMIKQQRRGDTGMSARSAALPRGPSPVAQPIFAPSMGHGRHDRRARRIVRAAGPWRLVERWAAEPVARDAYHVVLSDGTACWLVHDRLDEHDERWQVFGTFD
jgi:hypothetical protein